MVMTTLVIILMMVISDEDDDHHHDNDDGGDLINDKDACNVLKCSTFSTPQSRATTP